MAKIPTTLLFKGNRTYSAGAITFDLILSEGHSFTSSVTSYNIEDGSTISDHIENQTRTGTVAGLITNFSIYGGTPSLNKAQDAFNKIEQLYESNELVTVVTILKVYEDVAITSISTNRDSDTGEALIADFSFQTVTKVSLQEVELDAKIKLADMSTDQNKQSSQNVNAGKQTGVTG